MVRMKMNISVFCSLILMCIHTTENIILESIYQKYLQQGVEFRENVFLGNKPILSEYDFVIIGGGTAGSVVANRLSENPSWKILLLESGDDETIYQDIPLLSHFNSLTGFNWGYKLEEETQHKQCLAMNNHRCPCPRGKGLGGSSILNYMIYTRGNKKDYDAYEAAGNKGWGYNSVLKYFLKSENNTSSFLDEGFHSTQGPLKVQNVPYPNLLTEKFIQSGCELGYPIYDYTGKDPATEGFSKLQATISRGQRYSSSRAYLKSIKKRTAQNLHVAILSHVTKILIDPKSKKAHGVEFYKDGARRVVLVKKEVILSAGAVNSPQILMLSGVGPKQHLKEFDIETVADLRGVGQNMHDHHAFFGLTFLINRTNSGSLIEKKDVNVDQFLRWLNLGRGPFTVPGGVTGIGYISTNLNGDKSWPDTEYIFSIASFNSDAGRIFRKSLNVRKDVYDSVFKNINNREVWSVVPVVLRPKTRGFIKLKSKNAFKYPKIYYDFFQRADDEKVMLEAIKNVLKMSDTQAFRSIGSRVHNTPIPDCAQFEFGCDEYWRCAMRFFTSSLYHQSGTCKMGTAFDKDAVVDEQLQVYGVTNLRVVDASVFPFVPSAHLYAPTVMVAEKASDMIKEKWKNFNEHEPHKNSDCYANSGNNGYHYNANKTPCQQINGQPSSNKPKPSQGYKPKDPPKVPNQANFVQTSSTITTPLPSTNTTPKPSTTTTPFPSTTSTEQTFSSSVSGYPLRPTNPISTYQPYPEFSEPSTYKPPRQPSNTNRPIDNGQYPNINNNLNHITNQQNPNEQTNKKPASSSVYPPNKPSVFNSGSLNGFQSQQVNHQGVSNPTQINIFHQTSSQSYPSQQPPHYEFNHQNQVSPHQPPTNYYELNHQNQGSPYQPPNYHPVDQQNQVLPPQVPSNPDPPNVQFPPEEPSSPTDTFNPDEDILSPYSNLHHTYSQSFQQNKFLVIPPQNGLISNQIMTSPDDTIPIETANIRPNSLFDIPYYNPPSVIQLTAVPFIYQNRTLLPATIFVHPNFLYSGSNRYFNKRNSDVQNRVKEEDGTVEVMRKERFLKELYDKKLGRKHTSEPFQEPQPEEGRNQQTKSEPEKVQSDDKIGQLIDVKSHSGDKVEEKNSESDK